MGADVCAMQLDAIKIARPERPKCVDSHTVWQVPVEGAIKIRHPDHVARGLNDLYADQPGLVLWMDGYLPEWNDEQLACPECGCTTGLTLQGRWGDHATLGCPAGHQWTPTAHWSAPLLQEAITRSLDEHGAPPMPAV
ncbi:hypothetical protein [Streptomyces sp. x-80]|uniref:hypothetical protein n=1 Tax=Streptomyces sp. x-80 TaxID=2789282 RepID=UPI0039813ED0